MGWRVPIRLLLRMGVSDRAAPAGTGWGRPESHAGFPKQYELSQYGDEQRKPGSSVAVFSLRLSKPRSAVLFPAELSGPDEVGKLSHRGSKDYRHPPE